jgi:hypothetical protein
MRQLAFVPLALLCIGAATPRPDSAQPATPAGASPAAAKELQPQPALPGEILLTPPAHCALDTEPRQTQGQTLGPRRLDQLPQGNLSLAVMREVNGCPQSTTVREGYGAPAFRAEAPGR